MNRTVSSVARKLYPSRDYRLTLYSLAQEETGVRCSLEVLYTT